MYVFQHSAHLRRYLALYRASGRTLGFVPTMGALHEGHLSLVRRSLAQDDLTVCSIFVNPTQFNDSEDLKKYPRTPEKDIALLSKSGCTALFMPAVAEVYPDEAPPDTEFSFGALEQVMEGAFRPGHFRGVAQVVARLLTLVQPQRLYLGQKDFQQTAIVAEMLRQLQSDVELNIVPTMREPDGLAMSSRNARLSPEFRKAAPAIYKALLEARRLYPHSSAADINAQALQTLTAAGLRPEYFDIVDGHTLLPVQNGRKATSAVACVAAWAGNVRLIDNMVLIG
ncbi:MAG: pantoate--beta-alanine ligase [Saprospiraceae bacterium]|nr:pantoate--beta-alanine ligase [Saprospiraceae bacterium]